jgi:hypothetical protein
MTTGSAGESHVEWRDWGPEAFAAAEREGKPVLLSLVATWCGDCHRMDAETYAEPRIAANLADGFVPVRVDVDRRPRVRERYNMGGFPSTVFCTPSGRILSGATYLGPDGFRQVLDRVREVWDAKGEAAGRVPRGLDDEPTPVGAVTPAIEELVAGQLSEAFDDRYGGWGDGAKFPLPRTIEFALKREREQAVRTLDAVRENLFDPVDGGFFRFAGRRNWSDVRHEKLLADNAALLRAFANGYLHTGLDRVREPAAATVAFLTDDLWTGAAMGGSVGPAEGRDYYALDAAERAEAPAPRTDLTAFAGTNALAADALLAYHAYTDDERAREYAERTLATIRGLVDDDGRVVHYRATGDGPEPPAGLLADQARVAGAFARAAQVLGDGTDVARAAADYALGALRDGSGDGTAADDVPVEDGSGDAGSGDDPADTDAADAPPVDGSLSPFRDGPLEGVGLLDRPLYPLDATVEAADALLDLAALTGDERYREAARDAVAAFAGAADRMGVQVAGYGAVAARCVREPLVVDVATPPGSDLHRAALRVADHEKVVRPAADGVPDGTAAIVGADGPVGEPATTPDELMTRVSAWSPREGPWSTGDTGE